jgi:diguanylate cyclase (GGDEF)-like protein
MDLDGFKLINDSLGHAAGDQVLVQFVAAVGRHLRKQDQLGRMGGEEFVLLLPETTLEEATLVAERIRTATQAIQEPCAFTVSIGVAQLFQGEAALETLMERADAAMYRAKARGRNRVELEISPDTPLDLSVGQAPIKSILRRN